MYANALLHTGIYFPGRSGFLRDCWWQGSHYIERGLERHTQRVRYKRGPWLLGWHPYKGHQLVWGSKFENVLGITSLAILKICKDVWIYPQHLVTSIKWYAIMLNMILVSSCTNISVNSPLKFAMINMCYHFCCSAGSQAMASTCVISLSHR